MPINQDVIDKLCKEEATALVCATGPTSTSKHITVHVDNCRICNQVIHYYIGNKAVIDAQEMIPICFSCLISHGLGPSDLKELLKLPGLINGQKVSAKEALAAIITMETTKEGESN